MAGEVRTAPREVQKTVVYKGTIVAGEVKAALKEAEKTGATFNRSAIATVRVKTAPREVQPPGAVGLGQGTRAEVKTVFRDAQNHGAVYSQGSTVAGEVKAVPGNVQKTGAVFSQGQGQVTIGEARAAFPREAQRNASPVLPAQVAEVIKDGKAAKKTLTSCGFTPWHEV